MLYFHPAAVSLLEQVAGLDRCGHSENGGAYFSKKKGVYPAEPVCHLWQCLYLYDYFIGLQSG